MTSRTFSLALLVCAPLALAQSDLLRVSSPDGRIEFRLMVATPPEDLALPRLAYEVSYRGKLLIDTSYLGFNLHNQTPLLGEKVGLVTSKTSRAGKQTPYNSLVAEYMQNGSLGRRISMEVRAYNDGVAFRYMIPRSTPLESFLVENEYTEFAFAKSGEAYQNSKPVPLKSIGPDDLLAPPFRVHLPGIAWVAISEAGTGKGYPPMNLEHEEGNILMTKLPKLSGEPDLAIDATTPTDSPWRIVMIASTEEALLHSSILPNSDF